MAKHVFNVISIGCCCLELLNENSEPFGTASGFLWRHSDRVFLITNWHIVSALHAFSGQHLQNGRVPQALRVHYTVELAARLPNGDNLASHVVVIPLYDADFHHPFWLEHRARPVTRADVVAVEMPAIASGGRLHCINEHTYDDLVELVGVDVFPVGYPLGVVDGLKLPIWKRGSIATEPEVQWAGRPAFLIDCRTSSGMSGSPVLRQVFGPAPLANGTISVDRVRTLEFLGVYSGRLSDDDNIASIGIVWRQSVISELIDDPAPGRRDG